MGQFIRVLFMVGLFLMIPLSVIADDDDKNNGITDRKPPNYSQAIQSMNSFIQNVERTLNNVFMDETYNGYVEMLWTAFAVILLIMTFLKYSYGGPIDEVVQSIFLIVVARLIMENYSYLTSAFWDTSEGIAAGIQFAVVGDSDPFLLTAFIYDVLQGISTNDFSFFDGVTLLIAGFTVFIIVLILSVISFVVTMWALWGYALAKIVGYFFIPCIMLRRTTFLFDGWMRLFFGFLVYGIIARANLILMVLAIKSFFGIPGFTVDTNTVLRWEISCIADVIGLASFVFVGILALFATGKFASTFSSGAMGFGDSLQKMCATAAKMSRAFL